jgi:hypothetical protein
MLLLDTEDELDDTEELLELWLLLDTEEELDDTDDELEL